MTFNRITGLVASVAVLSALGGCFGGSSSEEAAAMDASKVPASALVSATAFSQYVATVIDGGSTVQLMVNDVTVPTSETALPIPVL